MATVNFKHVELKEIPKLLESDEFRRQASRHLNYGSVELIKSLVAFTNEYEEVGDAVDDLMEVLDGMEISMRCWIMRHIVFSQGPDKMLSMAFRMP